MTTLLAHHDRTRSPSVLPVAAIGVFMVVLDAMVINVALPTVRGRPRLQPRRTAVGRQRLHPHPSADCCCSAGASPTCLASAALLTGLAVFCGASLAGGLAPSPVALLAARAIQGAGAALLYPATLTIISTHYQAGPARNRAFGIWAGVAAVGNASGMLVGGILVGGILVGGILVGGILTNALSWRAVLFVNLPIGALAALLAARALPKPDPRAAPDRSVDVAGGITVTGSPSPRSPSPAPPACPATKPDWPPG